MSFDDLQFRSITLKFEVADLLNRNDDAVAIGCDKNFQLAHGIGHAFANRGDRQFTQELVQLRRNHPTIDAPTAFSIQGFGLNCRRLILVPLRQYFRATFEDVFSEIFQCAIQLGVSSLAFPPIGAGGYSIDRSDVANAMKLAFETQVNFGSVTQITIVDNSTSSIRYIRNVLENFAADDLLNNPNLYAPVVGNAADPSNIAQPHPNQAQIQQTPFGMFYVPQTLEQLKELRKERLEARSEIDTPLRDEEEQLEACPICLIDMLEESDDYNEDDDDTIVKLNRCVHLFHRKCLISWFTTKAQCPICNTWYMPKQGTQPTNGTMRVEVLTGRIPGYTERTHIRITYKFPNGTQGNEHPQPGRPYKGTRRVCYLPNTTEGDVVSKLLRIAFNRRLIFTIGDSVTTGQQNIVTWNGIHHKTAKHGGPTNFGFPDTGYFTRVKQELAAIGITEDMLSDDEDMDDDDSD